MKDVIYVVLDFDKCVGKYLRPVGYTKTKDEANLCCEKAINDGKDRVWMEVEPIIEHEGKPEAELEGYEKTREQLREIMSNHNVNLEMMK